MYSEAVLLTSVMDPDPNPLGSSPFPRIRICILVADPDTDPLNVYTKHTYNYFNIKLSNLKVTDIHMKLKKKNEKGKILNFIFEKSM